MNFDFSIRTGLVVASTGAARCYVVEVGGQSIDAVLVTGSTAQLGQIEHLSLLPGTPVLCACCGSLGFILGALPAGVANELDRFCPTSISGSSVGDLVGPLRVLRDVFAGRVEVDSMATDLLPGEAGSLNTLGVGWLGSLFHATLQAAPDASVTVSMIDRLVRVVGAALEIYSCGSADIALAIGDEVVILRGEAPSKNEAVGASAGTPALREREASTVDAELKGPFETVEDAQVPIFRLQEHGGAAGGLRAVRVSSPATGAPVSLSSTALRSIGLSEQLTASDGRVVTRSARGIAFIKTPDITIPQQIGRHEVEATEDIDDIDDVPELSATDGISFVAKVKHAIATIYRKFYKKHPTVWSVPAGTDALAASGLSSAITDASALTDLTGSKALADPAAVSITVNGSSVTVYAGEAVMALTDKGEIYLQDCWGCSVQSSAGSLFLSAPGDVSCRAGRDVSMVAGRDLVLKAGGNLEGSTAEGSIRLKAEKEIAAMSGNGGTGGVLLESRATSAVMSYTDVAGDFVTGSGVTLLAKNSHVTALSPAISFTAEKLDKVAPSALAITAPSLTVQAEAINAQLDTGLFVTFSSADTSITAASSGVIIGNGGLLVEDYAYVTSGPLLVSGMILGKSVAYDGKSATMLGGADGELKRAMTDIKKSVSSAKSSASNSVDAAVSMLESAPQTSAETKKNIGFSFRSDDEYEATGSDPAMPWQAWLETGGVWEEPAVEAPSGALTYPSPGSSWNSEAITISSVSGLCGADGTTNDFETAKDAKIDEKAGKYVTLRDIGGSK